MPTRTSVADILAEISKKDGLKIGLVNDVVAPVVGLTTGDLAIDYVTGVGGIPQGRITELYGPPSSGKTTTALQAAADYQRRIIEAGIDDRILYLDFEQTFDPEYAEALGIDVDHPSFVLAQPHWLEQGGDIAIKLIKTGLVRMSIFDSVAAMTPKNLDGFEARTSAMERARLVGGLCRYMAPLLKEQHCCAVMVNHAVEAIEMTGRPGMPPRTTSPGGRGLKFYASLRLEYKQIGNTKAKGFDPLANEVNDQTAATKIKVTTTKNKVGRPFRTAEVRIRYGAGFDNAWSALRVLLAHKKIVAGGGGYFYFDKAPTLVRDDMDRSNTGRPTIRGEAGIMQYADTNPDWRNALIAEAVALVDAYGADVLDTGDAVAEDEL